MSSHRILASVFSLGLLALVFTGCAQEDSYCDETGCYQCDGLGCRPVVPPGRETTCQFNYECGANRVCRNEQCLSECDASNPCPDGSSCSAAGICIDDAPETCASDEACDGEQVCIAGECRDECAVDSDCGDERYCASGVCRVDDRPRPFCTSDAQCRSGNPCVGGVCRTPCERSNDCLRYDVQFSVCQEGFCVTSNEATSDCSTRADCNGNQSCIDGICRNN
jgi:hypothetical protein